MNKFDIIEQKIAALKQKEEALIDEAIMYLNDLDNFETLINLEIAHEKEKMQLKNVNMLQKKMLKFSILLLAISGGGSLFLSGLVGIVKHIPLSSTFFSFFISILVTFIMASAPKIFDDIMIYRSQKKQPSKDITSAKIDKLQKEKALTVKCYKNVLDDLIMVEDQGLDLFNQKKQLDKELTAYYQQFVQEYARNYTNLLSQPNMVLKRIKKN